MKGFLLGVLKLILGISLAMVLLSLAGVATARYFMAKLSVLPPKPVFNNDAIAEATNAAAPSVAVPASQPAPAPTPATPATPAKPPGSYEAIVVQPIGLVLRSGPGGEYEQLGGVDHNDTILVLKASDDGAWLNVRLQENGQEGWVKAGNVQRVSPPAQ